MRCVDAFLDLKRMAVHNEIPVGLVGEVGEFNMMARLLQGGCRLLFSDVTF